MVVVVAILYRFARAIKNEHEYVLIHDKFFEPVVGVSHTRKNYSKTPIYRGVWGKGNTRGKSGSAVNRGFVWCTLCNYVCLVLFGGKEMAAVYRGLR